uniref:Integrase, catalytic region, zinc finger, CCHC-type, peptidase aspartic, catalytic n=1 Tax=Tanacetum cinerariifolium TaxID=118510 RepID=A0A6L2NAJ3_TANCI|nr:integrase, catalytic region, zinc finger, CCHC-type, peptidase aspartic, catalytic [Tanacetum cinerariifolium]
MINSIKNGDQPLPRVTQVSISRTSSTEQPPLKDKSMWSDQEKKIQKINRLARSLSIQGLPNDIYSLIDSNKTAKDLWDALARHMFGSEYGEQDRKAAVLYEYETFKATEGELLLDTYIRYLQAINDLKKCGYSKDNSMKSKKKAVVITSDPLVLVAEQTKVRKRKEKVLVSSESEGSDDDLKKITTLLAKAFNRKKFYSKPTNNNLRTSLATSLANKKQEYVKSNDKNEENKVDEKKREMSKVKCYNCKKEGHFVKDYKKAKVKDYEYYKKKMLLAKKDKDEQVILAEDHARMESSSDSDQEINANMVFMAQIEKVLLDSEASSSSSNDKIVEVKNNELNEQIKVLIENNDNLLAQRKALQEQLKVKHVVIDDHVECQAKYTKLEAERYEYMIRYFAYFDNDKQHRKQIADQEILFHKMSRRLVELDENVRMLKNTVLEKDLKISEFEEYVCNKDLEIEKCIKILNECENKLYKIRQTNQTIHMIMPYKDKTYNGRKGIGFENPSYFCKAKDLRPTLYDERVIGPGNAYCNSYDVDVNDLFVIDDIIDSGCSKHMTGNRALLTNFVKKFLETVRFGNNDFAVIVGYGDVVIGSMTIKKVYYVEGLGHNLFSVGQFCDNGLEVAFRKSTCFVRTKGGVDLITGDRYSNLYTIALNEVASNSSACLIAKDSSSQSWLWHQRLSHLNFTTINNLVKNNLVQDMNAALLGFFLAARIWVGPELGTVHRSHVDLLFKWVNAYLEVEAVALCFRSILMWAGIGDVPEYVEFLA